MLSLEAQENKLELGLGLGYLYYPNYIGSKHSQSLLVPLPYIRYTGDYFRIDENGVTGELFGINGLRLELSMSGSLPASSDSSGAREGMPDLDLTGEIGPKLVYNLYEKGVSKLELEVDIRATLSTDFSSISYIGLTSSPQLRYSLNYSAFEWTFRTGVSISDKNYNNYYYGVQEQYANASRVQYSTKGGCSGFKSRVGMTYKKGDWWGGAFLSYFNISQSVFKDSPLVETNDAFYGGASIAYIFYATR